MKKLSKQPTNSHLQKENQLVNIIIGDKRRRFAILRFGISGYELYEFLRKLAYPKAHPTPRSHCLLRPWNLKRC